ncbi:hypothetical protein VMT65_32480 [Nocardia sp. CDC153]|uniref:hypothetical protein n=1 Tax=Nocardia sp. CDC153 TaxID=3112167 RepID=UPI002DBCDFCE|nr:hypothetical protein [Nocardia sp. CDC153]MEC3957790.1 hypothetical protein [Nocardia sp. CDC153]
MNLRETFFSPYGLPFVWGSTDAEVRETFPCDTEVGDGTRTDPHRAIDIAAPPPVVYRWLCQIRVAPYSYDLLNNLGRRSPRTLTPGLEDLRLGQRFMTLFTLVSFVYDEHVTIRVSHWIARLLLGDLAISYVIRPIGSDGTRLLVKLTLPRARRLGYVRQYFLGWLDLFMMRRQMVNMRDLSEAHRAIMLAGHAPGQAASAARTNG